jgi:hypothetical protein
MMKSSDRFGQEFPPKYSKLKKKGKGLPLLRLYITGGKKGDEISDN